jgi:nucleoside-diphosphate-sugar epimerase
MASRRLVLITGINGYIAAHTAAAFLKAGYAVRGTIRAKTGNAASLARALSRYHDGDRLELVEVPDVGVDGAFDAAVQGSTVTAHIHQPKCFTDM